MSKMMKTQFGRVFDVVGAKKFTVDPASAAAGAEISGTLTLTGAAIGDMVMVSPGVDLQTMLLSATVISANTIEWVLNNETAGAIDLASSTWKVVVLRINDSFFNE